MKNLSLFIASAFIAIFCISSSANAQSQARFGIKAGVSLFTLGSATTNGVSINYQYRPGFQGGFFADLPLSESISFSPQALYTQKGGNLNTTINGVTIKGHSQLNYIDVPFLFGFKVSPQFTFFAGPQVSFLMSQTTFVDVTGFGSDTSTDKTRSNSTVFGGNLGAGYEITDQVGLNVHYAFDFQKAEKGQYTTGERNSGFALTIGYKF